MGQVLVLGSILGPETLDVGCSMPFKSNTLKFLLLCVCAVFWVCILHSRRCAPKKAIGYFPSQTCSVNAGHNIAPMPLLSIWNIILNNLVETELFSLAPSSQNGSLEAWYQTSEGQYKNSVPNKFLSLFFSTSFVSTLNCTVWGCIRCDHFTGREAIHQIWQVLPVSNLRGEHHVVWHEWDYCMCEQ